MLQSHKIVSVPPIAADHQVTTTQKVKTAIGKRKDGMREVEPALCLRERGDHPLPHPVARLGGPVDGAGRGLAQHGTDAKPFDVGEEPGEQHGRDEDGQADDDDQRPEARGQTGDDDDESRDGKREAEQRVAGVDAELAKKADAFGRCRSGGGHALDAKT